MERKMVPQFQPLFNSKWCPTFRRRLIAKVWPLFSKRYCKTCYESVSADKSSRENVVRLVKVTEESGHRRR